MNHRNPTVRSNPTSAFIAIAAIVLIIAGLSVEWLGDASTLVEQGAVAADSLRGQASRLVKGGRSVLPFFRERRGSVLTYPVWMRR